MTEIEQALEKDQKDHKTTLPDWRVLLLVSLLLAAWVGLIVTYPAEPVVIIAGMLITATASVLGISIDHDLKRGIAVDEAMASFLKSLVEAEKNKIAPPTMRKPSVPFNVPKPNVNPTQNKPPFGGTDFIGFSD